MQAYCRKAPFLEAVAAFHDSLDALAWLRDNPVDLIFLDINMPDLNGLQFARALRDAPPIVFTTAYSEHAVSGFELDAVDYLLKPIPFDRFLQAADKARRRLAATEPVEAATPEAAPLQPPLQQREGFVFVKSGHSHVRLEIAALRYLESERNYVTWVTKRRRIMALMKLDEALQMLPAGAFARVHKSYIVSLAKVDEVRRGVCLLGEEEIPIGDAYRKDFLAAIQRGG
nr:LytTR family DNA-binding domain-containing protein [Acanthopleuribacter pedis]